MQRPIPTSKLDEGDRFDLMSERAVQAHGDVSLSARAGGRSERLLHAGGMLREPAREHRSFEVLAHAQSVEVLRRADCRSCGDTAGSAEQPVEGAARWFDSSPGSWALGWAAAVASRVRGYESVPACTCSATAASGGAVEVVRQRAEPTIEWRLI